MARSLRAHPEALQISIFPLTVSDSPRPLRTKNNLSFGSVASGAETYQQLSLQKEQILSHGEQRQQEVQA